MLVNKFAWTQRGNDYITSFLHGQAIISQQNHLVEGLVYAIRIEDHDGSLLDDVHGCYFAEFEDAASVAAIRMVEVDQANPSTRRQRLLQTLDLCKMRLPATLHPAHGARLDAIREWVVRHHEPSYMTEVSRASRVLPRQRTYTFTWVKYEGMYRADTPHGRAVIIERSDIVSAHYVISDPIWFKAHLEHPTGAVLGYPFSWTHDFARCELELQETLAELDDPAVIESYLHCVDFTLSICQCILPSAVDPMHYERLDFLKTWICDALL